MSRFLAFLKRIGPGFISGAADDDPSGIATYSQTGAQFGYGQLWTALFATPFMIAIQEMCGRIGMVTGEGLATVIKRRYPRPILVGAITLLFAANAINIGADLGAMASATQLLFGLPTVLWLIVITASSLLLEIFVTYAAYARFLKYLTFSLLAYVVAAFVIHQDWGAIAYSTFVPAFSFDRAYLLNIVAILGTTISPYLFFWQSDQEVEEDRESGRVAVPGAVPVVSARDVRDMRLDTAIGMVFSNLVMFFIIVTAASTFGAHGIRSIDTATQAAEALRPLAGNFASVIFALGILGTGLLAVPILAGSAAYAVVEAAGIGGGLNRKFHEARVFYGVIIIATVIGLVTNFIGIPPFKMLYYTAIFNGLVAPPLMFLILHISSDRAVMGVHVNGRVSNGLGWIIMAVMTLAGLALLANALAG
ncbi:MAG: hypothetical protein RLZZ324_422 [Candidatus Parcubacteria bacterium]|jgi:NRAMP (natural resistance-associated macrophage protein)-like metal ion transporter